jgi:hypothetical protein
MNAFTFAKLTAIDLSLVRMCFLGLCMGLPKVDFRYNKCLVGDE